MTISSLYMDWVISLYPNKHISILFARLLAMMTLNQQEKYHE